MISLDAAWKLAEESLQSLALACGEPLTLQAEHTIERSLVFAFFYQTQEFVRSGNPSAQLAGNGPLLVNRITGEVQAAGSAQPPEHYIYELEAKLSVEGRL